MAALKVIKYEGSNDTLVWKHPIEDFNTTSQLVVDESQEAVLYQNGQALDLFTSGRYTLGSENIPLLRRIINFASGGVTPFHCKVYFINKVDIMNILWGTSNPIPIQDPIYDIILPVRSHGRFVLRVEDSRKFLVKVVGTIKEVNKESLTNYFRGLLMTRIKNYISSMMMDKKITFLHVHSYLNEISDGIHEQISPVFSDYGLTMVNFFTESISVPSDDPGYIQIRNALATAKEQELLAKGKRAEMDIIGYNYQQERTYDVLEKAASNEGASANLMGASMGLGIGLPFGGMVGNAISGAISNVAEPNSGSLSPARINDTHYCFKCQSQLSEKAKFCSECGTKQLELNSENIICSNCNRQIPKGKLCINCGHKLEAFCFKCGTAVPPNGKFCLECGQNLKEGGVENEK